MRKSVALLVIPLLSSCATTSPRPVGMAADARRACEAFADREVAGIERQAVIRPFLAGLLVPVFAGLDTRVGPDAIQVSRDAFSAAGRAAAHNEWWSKARASGLDHCLKPFSLAETLGPHHPDVARSFFELADAHAHRAMYAEAEPHYRRALAIWARAWGPEHPTLARPLFLDFGRARAANGRYAEAERFHRRAVVIREEILGPEHPAVAEGLRNLAEAHVGLGHHAEAEALYVRVLTIQEKALGPVPDPEPARSALLARPPILVAPHKARALATTLDGYAALLRTLNRAAEATATNARAWTVRASAGLTGASEQPIRVVTGHPSGSLDGAAPRVRETSHDETRSAADYRSCRPPRHSQVETAGLRNGHSLTLGRDLDGAHCRGAGDDPRLPQ